MREHYEHEDDFEYDHEQVKLHVWDCHKGENVTFECDRDIAWLVRAFHALGYPTWMSCADLDHGELGPTVWFNFHGPAAESLFDDLLHADREMEDGCALLRVIQESRNILTFEEGLWHLDEYGALVCDAGDRDRIDCPVIDFRFWVLKEREAEFYRAFSDFFMWAEEHLLDGELFE